jgi:predicted LPLAT superfamily acyltransferase
MTQSWEGKSKGNTLGYRIFIGILRFAGTKPAYFLLRFVAFYYFVFSRKSTRHIYQYFRLRQGFSKWKSVRGVYRNYYIFGQTLIDKIVVMAGLKAPYTHFFDGEHYFNDMVAEGRGGILISAHVGNWELAGHYFKRLPIKLNILMFEGEHKQIKQYLDSVMSDKNLNIIVLKDDLSHIYEIGAALGRNELVAIHADRFVAGSRTIRGKLLSEEANFPIGPFVLATTFKVPISYVFSLKETNTHYHMFASKPKTYTANKQVAIPEALSDFTRELEAKLKQYPEQWFNYYDFWKQ